MEKSEGGNNENQETSKEATAGLKLRDGGLGGSSNWILRVQKFELHTDGI